MVRGPFLWLRKRSIRVLMYAVGRQEISVCEVRGCRWRPGERQAGDERGAGTLIAHLPHGRGRCGRSRGAGPFGTCGICDSNPLAIKISPMVDISSPS